MFGEELMYGQKKVSIDEKGRLWLPTYTKREKGDKLLLIHEKDISLYKICSISTYDDIMLNLEKNLYNASNRLDEIYYKKRICEVSESIINKMIVDSQGRVKVGQLYGKNKILCIGAGNHVMLMPVKYSNTNTTKL